MKTAADIEFGLNQDTIQKMQRVFSKFPEIDEVLIFGSRVKGNYREGSDIDLAFKGDSLSHDKLIEVEIELDDLLLPYIIQSVLFRNIDNTDLIDHINRVGKIFYKK